MDAAPVSACPWRRHRSRRVRELSQERISSLLSRDLISCRCAPNLRRLGGEPPAEILSEAKDLLLPCLGSAPHGPRRLRQAIQVPAINIVRVTPCPYSPSTIGLGDSPPDLRLSALICGKGFVFPIS